MTTEYLRKDRIPHAAGRNARLGGLFAGLATLLLAACSSSSSDGGPTAPPPPPPPPPPPTNTAPTAAAGPDMTVSTTIGVQLDGSASSDADGDAITYAWSFAFVPSGSAVAFDDETAAQPSFTPDVAGDYTIELVVSDGTVTSNTDEIVVTAGDNTATQSIGPGGGQIVSADGIVTLDIPAGALMLDEDVAITYIPEDQRDSYLGPEFDGIDFIDVVYDLAPDGLTFNTPATVTVAMPNNPAIAADTIGGPIQLLLSSDGTTAELLSDITMVVDVDAGTYQMRGSVEHFSPLAWSIEEHTALFNWDISGVPDRLGLNDVAVARSTVSSAALELLGASYEDRRAAPTHIFIAIDRITSRRAMNRQGGLEDFTLDVDYGCTQESTIEDFYIVSLEADPDLSMLSTDSRLYQLLIAKFNETGLINFRVEALKDVECRNPTPATTRIATGIKQTIATINWDGFMAGYLLSDFVPGSASGKTESESAAVSAAIGTNDPVGLFAGANGNVLLNLLTGGVIRDGTDPQRTDPAFGAVIASSILPDGTPAGMLYQHGAGTFGGLRCDYDPVTDTFGTFCLTQTGTVYDAVPLGNTHQTTQVSFATNFGVGVWELDPNFGTYERSSDFNTGTNAFFGTPFSAVRVDPVGPMLVISNNAPDYTTLSIVDPDGTVTEVQTFFGEDGRKLRCVVTLCAISVFNDGNGGALRFVTWDGINTPTIVDTTVTVGDGPVGHDGIALTNGNVLWVSTGFNDDTITVTEVTPTGAVVSSNTDPVPTGCLRPGHANWFVPNGAMPEAAQIIGTCFDSNVYYVLDVLLDPTDGFRIVPLP